MCGRKGRGRLDRRAPYFMGRQSRRGPGALPPFVLTRKAEAKVNGLRWECIVDACLLCVGGLECARGARQCVRQIDRSIEPLSPALPPPHSLSGMRASVRRRSGPFNSISRSRSRIRPMSSPNAGCRSFQIDVDGRRRLRVRVDARSSNQSMSLDNAMRLTTRRERTPDPRRRRNTICDETN